ncbi:MAG: hypothetical protein K2N73_03480 [Lachnospiraceae bacterium]|nr:hypothetical protein [Lachnospiraceae bacterium]
MTGYDILVFLVVAGFIAYTVYKKKKKKLLNNGDTFTPLSNYTALRNYQQTETLHGVSIISIYYDNVASYKDMEADGTNTGFDLSCENKINNALKALKADGYNPVLNALPCMDRVIFYITY